MFTSADQVTHFNKSALEAMMGVAKLSFDTTERVFGLSLEIGKESLAEASKNAKALADVKDAHALMDLRTKATEASVEKALDYSRTMYEVAANTQSQLSAMFEQHTSELNKNFATAVENAVKSAPIGADVALAAVKSTVAASSAAMESMTKAAKQVSNYADAGVKATTEAAVAAVKTSKATKTAK